MIRPPPRSTLFPYPPLSRSQVLRGQAPPVRRNRRAGDVARGRQSVSLTHRAVPVRDDDEVVTGTEHYKRILLASEGRALRSEEHTSELQSQSNLVCRLLLEK